jgi:5-methylcytosine-specific restriction endonuclease McrA
MTHGKSGYVLGCRCEVCREGVRAYNKAWRAANKERVSRYGKQYHRRKKARVAERSKTRYEAIKDDSAYLERHNRNQKRYHERHKDRPEYVEKRRKLDRTTTAGRRARKRDQFLEKVDAVTVYEMHGGRCGICGEFIDGAFHVDHIRPLSNGGLHAYINVQPAHALCNMRKGGDAK